jgi:hypothetical protein
MSIVPTPAGIINATTAVTNNVVGDQTIVNEYHYTDTQQTRSNDRPTSNAPIVNHIVINNITGDQYVTHNHYYGDNEGENRLKRKWAAIVEFWLRTKK